VRVTRDVGGRLFSDIKSRHDRSHIRRLPCAVPSIFATAMARVMPSYVVRLSGVTLRGGGQYRLSWATAKVITRVMSYVCSPFAR